MIEAMMAALPLAAFAKDDSVYRAVITPVTKTYQLRSITWGQHLALVISDQPKAEILAGGNRKAIKLWYAMRNQERARSHRRRAYWKRVAAKFIRSMDMYGR